MLAWMNRPSELPVCVGKPGHVPGMWQGEATQPELCHRPALLLTTTGRDYCSCGCQFSVPGWAGESRLKEEECLGGVGRS